VPGDGPFLVGGDDVDGHAALAADHVLHKPARLVEVENKLLQLEWAREAGMRNWAEYFLKYIVSLPGVTCAIPATSKVAHLRENMGALHGPLPDAGIRHRMAEHLARL